MVNRSASVGWELVKGEMTDSFVDEGSCDIGGMMTCSWREADADSAKGRMNARRRGRRMVTRCGDFRA